MKFSALQISQVLGGTVEGDANVSVDRLAKIEQGSEGSVSFLANPKYTPYIYTTQASIVIVANDFVPAQPINATLIRVEDPYVGFTTILSFYDEYIRKSKTGVEQPSFQSSSASLGHNLYLGAFSYIGENSSIADDAKIYPQVYIGDNVTIGRGTILYSGAKIHRDTVIGEDCIIHSGVVIGADGFGFAPQSDGSYKKIPQIGNVIIESNVEIGANTTIDRATMGSTVIRQGVKLDNLIQIAHNVEIGKDTVMAAQAGVAGSTKIGANGYIGGQTGFSGHIKIGDRVKIGAQSGVLADVADDSTLLGTPALDYKDFMKSYVYFRKLPNLAKQIDQINKKLDQKDSQI